MRKNLFSVLSAFLFLSSAFAQQPVVNTVAPLFGNVGATVTITGTGFNTTPGDNIVYFGATKTTVTAASTTSLTVTVPSGATYMPVSVNNIASGLTGFSLMPFLPGFDNSAYDATAIIFSPEVAFAAGSKPAIVALADFDGDGRTDMVVSDTAGGNGVIVYRNTSASGTITAGSFDAGVAFATSQNTKDVMTGDVDGDGKPDIIVANSGSILSYVTVFRNTTTSGAFTAASFAARVDFAANAGAQGVAMGDLDMDGRSDIVVTCASNVVNIFRNLSTVGSVTPASLAPKENFTPGTTPSMLTIADIDGDGKQDMAVVNSGSNNISVFRNVMAGPGPIVPASFAAIVNFATGTTPHGIIIDDVDGDGKQDMCVTNAGSNFVSVYRNTSTAGTCSFAARVDFTTGSAPYNLSAADLNGDGKPDLVVSNNATNNISVLRNTSVSGTVTASSFAAATNITTPINPNGIVAGDLDGDGKPDVAVVSAAAVYVLRNNPMAPITGTLNVCIGGNTLLSNTTGGGTWSSSSTAIATVDLTTGLVAGVSSGTVIISYNIPGASATAIVTVTALANAGTISGAGGAVCPGATVALTDAAAGGVWSSTDVAVGTVSASGVVTAIAAGTTTISYTVSTGCSTVAATVNITVNALPDAGTLSGTATVCAGSTVTLASTEAGGTWSTADVLVAGIDATTGEITGIAAGTATIVYTRTNTCGVATANYLVTVNAIPDISGTSGVCVGGTQTLTSTITTGVWSSANTSLATVGASSGVVSGVLSGVVVISYTDNGCSGTFIMTVDQVPVAGTLSGVAVFCFGTDISITSTVTDGAWSSSDVAIATVGTSGLVTGVDEGTAIISHTISNSCGAATATTVVTVDVTPDVGVISGPSSVCASGSTVTLTNTVATGTWSSANTLAATISAAGVVTGADPGTSTISYTVSNSCGVQAATVIVTVNPLPDPITGTFVLCKDATAVLGSITTGGAWTSSAPAVTVDASGVITGISAGTSRITYTLVVGCFRTVVVTVNPLPPAILGTSGVCMGNTTTLTNAVSGGTWVSTNTAVANIGSSTGIVSTVGAGTTIITYTRPSTGCYTTRVLTVNPLPDPITGDFVICTGKTDTFSCSPAGGTWQSSIPSIAPVATSTGVVLGATSGIANITYTTTAGCKTWVTVTVNQTPSAISGTLAVCEGSTSMLTNTLPFGVWVSSNTAVGVISGSGVVAGVAPGTSIVSYVMPTGCSRSVVVTINPLPVSITGASSLCAGTTTTLTGMAAGGSWISSNVTLAVAGTSGVVTGLAAGSVVISYILPTGCKLAHLMTVNPVPANITGALMICEGGTSLLATSPLGGSWASSNTSIATVGSTAGVLTGVAAGTAVISYSLFSTGCMKTATVTINPLPSVSSIATGVCVGATATLTSTPAGGTWQSGSPSIATIATTSGVVTGIAGGTVMITYTSPSGCRASNILTVNPLAVAGTLLGTPTVCEGATITLTPTVPGGTWSSVTGNTSVDAGGAVTGITGGVDTIVYVVTNGCSSAQTTYAMTVDALPPVGTITGGTEVCVGLPSPFVASVVGGAWSSSDASIVTVAGGLATGVSAGSAVISYFRTNFCGTSAATLNVTVVPVIDAGSIAGSDTVCYQNTVNLTCAVAGGTWFSTSLFVSVNAATGEVTGLAPGVAVIKYAVSNGCSKDTALFSIYVKYSIDCPTTHTESVTALSDIKLYPVPAHGVLTLESPMPGELTVYTIDGRAIANYVTDGKMLQFSLPAGIAPGMYVCRFKAIDGSSKMMRIVYEP